MTQQRSQTLQQYRGAHILLCWESHDGHSAGVFLERARALFDVRLLPAEQMHPVYRKVGLFIAELRHLP